MIDTLVIGGGLAGSLLTQKLIANGISVNLLDDGSESSSRVAGGLINPVTGKRFGTDAKFFHYYNNAVQDYLFLPGALRLVPIIRVVSDEQERQIWAKKSATLSSASLIREIEIEILNREVDCGIRMNDSDIVLAVQNGAMVDTRAVIQELHQRFRNADVLLPRERGQVTIHSNSISLGSQSYSRVVFCEGWHIRTNPLFSNIPTMFAKGQLLHVRFEREVRCDHIIIHNGKFLAPRADGTFLFGATYEWNDVSAEVSTGTTQFLCEIFERSFAMPYRVLEARAGVRPIIADMKAIVGRHPQYEHVYVLNGLGSKGALLAPTLSRVLMDCMLFGAEVPADINVNRFS